MNKARLLQLYKKRSVDFTGNDTLNSRVVIIDGTNTFMRVFANTPALNEDGQHVGGVVGFLKSIGSNIRQFQATRCIVVFDGSGGSQRRKKVYAEYKGNRTSKGKLNRFSEFDGLIDEGESMKLQFTRIFEYLEVLPITLVVLDNIEADDTIAYITHLLEGDNQKVKIVSSDRDFLQLITDNINVYSPIKKKLYDLALLTEELGIHPKNYLLYRALTGDTSDNIGGVKGIGLTTLLKHFPEFAVDELSVGEFLKLTTEKIALYKKPPAALTAIINQKDILHRNLQLMQLQDVDISEYSKSIIRNALVTKSNSFDIIKFKQLFLHDKIYSSIKNGDEWVRNTFLKLSTYDA